MVGVFEITGWALLVHAAALTQIAGYLTRNQMVLRVLLLAGNVLYGAYYWLYPPLPLWDAIFWSVLLVLSNIVGMAAILADRRRYRMSADEAWLYGLFRHVTPGEFRMLMREAELCDRAPGAVLTEVGKVPGTLYYVLSGAVEIAKRDRTLTEPPGAFIGEVAFLSGGPASATVRLPEGGRVIAWRAETLRRLMARRPTLQNAMHCVLSRDMAAKIRRA